MQHQPEETSAHLVIADDSAAMRWLVRAAVGKDFAAVVEVADGRELFWTLLRSSFASQPHQVVVTDLCMPEYDGLDVIAAWRELQPQSPAIVITAFPSEEARRRAAAAGAVMLAKPFSTADLREAVRRAIRASMNGSANMNDSAGMTGGASERVGA